MVGGENTRKSAEINPNRINGANQHGTPIKAKPSTEDSVEEYSHMERPGEEDGRDEGMDALEQPEVNMNQGDDNE